MSFFNTNLSSITKQQIIRIIQPDIKHSNPYCYLPTEYVKLFIEGNYKMNYDDLCRENNVPVDGKCLVM
jgi:hypothetical protein